MKIVFFYGTFTHIIHSHHWSFYANKEIEAGQTSAWGTNFGRSPENPNSQKIYFTNKGGQTSAGPHRVSYLSYRSPLSIKGHKPNPFVPMILECRSLSPLFLIFMPKFAPPLPELVLPELFPIPFYANLLYVRLIFWSMSLAYNEVRLCSGKQSVLLKQLQKKLIW